MRVASLAVECVTAIVLARGPEMSSRRPTRQTHETRPVAGPRAGREGCCGCRAGGRPRPSVLIYALAASPDVPAAPSPRKAGRLAAPPHAPYLAPAGCLATMDVGPRRREGAGVGRDGVVRTTPFLCAS